MNLKMVTWEGDLTQFIVDAENNTEAINNAIKAHLAFDKDNFGERNPDDEDDVIAVMDMKDVECYSVDNIDMKLLSEIVERKDVCGYYENVIVLFGA